MDLRLGQAVEVVVALDSQTQPLAGTTGVLIREEEHKGQRVWALEFKEMRDSEREKIVQFVVARQREQLRERHLSPSA
jgi:c-di-GMP-binding flagellar brake protein YcgR